MHALRRFLLPLLAATLPALAAAPRAHAEPAGDKPGASIAPNLVPNLGAQVQRPSTTQPAKPAPAPAPVAPVAKQAPAAPALTAPVTAAAKPAVTLPTGQPSFEVIDRGDTVEVIAHNIKAARTAVLPLRSRLQIPIAGAPVAKRVTPADRTVKLIELDSEDATRVLSVKLGLEYPETKMMSRYAQAIQIGDDLHVLVPRKLPADGAAPKLPEPTLSAAAAAAMAKADHSAMLGPAPNPNAPPPPVAPPKPEAKPEPKIEAAPAKPEPPKPAVAAVTEPAKVAPVEKILGPAPDPNAKPVPKPEAKAESDDDKADKADKVLGPEKPADKQEAKEAKEPEARPAHERPKTDRFGRVIPADDDAWSKIAMYAAFGLGAAGVGVWMLKRRRLHIPPNAEIDILAQRSLGGKARIVWLGAGEHEILVAVTPQAVNLLGQWPRGAGAASLPADDTFAGRMAHTLGPLGQYAAAAGPSVARAPSQSMPIQRAPSQSMPAVSRSRTGAYRQVTVEPDDLESDREAAVPQPAADVRSAALRTARAAAIKHADSLAALDVDPPAPPPRAVTTEYAPDEGEGYAIDDEAEEVAPPPARPAKPSRAAIVLPPVPAAIANEARIRRESQAVRPATEGDADKPVSPAVNGILRLRGRTSQIQTPPPPADVEIPDVDNEMIDDSGEAKGNAEISEETREAEQAWIRELMSGGQ